MGLQNKWFSLAAVALAMGALPCLADKGIDGNIDIPEIDVPGSFTNDAVLDIGQQIKNKADQPAMSAENGGTGDEPGTGDNGANEIGEKAVGNENLPSDLPNEPGTGNNGINEIGEKTGEENTNMPLIPEDKVFDVPAPGETPVDGADGDINKEIIDVEPPITIEVPPTDGSLPPSGDENTNMPLIPDDKDFEVPAPGIVPPDAGEGDPSNGGGIDLPLGIDKDNPPVDGNGEVVEGAPGEPTDENIPPQDNIDLPKDAEPYPMPSL